MQALADLLSAKICPQTPQVIATQGFWKSFQLSPAFLPRKYFHLPAPREHSHSFFSIRFPPE